MISSTQLMLFAATSVVLIFTPGPDIIYVMTRGVAQGRKAALAAAAGFSLGNFVHIFFALVGLSALLASSARAFQLVKYVGALYLIYLGVRMFCSKTDLAAGGELKPLRGRTIFLQSIVANVLNPKVAIFFLAFFPQFLDKEQGSLPLQMFLLGTLFVLLTLVCFGLVGFCSGWLGGWLQKKTAIGNRLGRIAGSVLVLLGLRLAWSEVH
ncbi:MAG: LysE family translocator [Desulfuromonadaceae bacterium]|nr:LysE family translocator [Desulfuromonadaceae bacterium]